jgi:hypothetical protein
MGKETDWERSPTGEETRYTGREQTADNGMVQKEIHVRNRALYDYKTWANDRWANK